MNKSNHTFNYNCDINKTRAFHLLHPSSLQPPLGVFHAAGFGDGGLFAIPFRAEPRPAYSLLLLGS